MTPDINRRKLLGAGGAALAVGLAGCAAFADGRGVPGTEGGMEEREPVGPPEGIPLEVHEYLTADDVGANGYDREMVDETGEDQITIMNGAGAGFAFDPVLVNIDPGTEVTWEWTGEGGAHNVESTQGPVEFSSGDAVVEEGHTWSFTFEEEGNYFYHCAPHTGSGMHGAIVVGEPDLENGEEANGEDENGEEENGDNGETTNGNGNETNDGNDE